MGFSFKRRWTSAKFDGNFVEISREQRTKFNEFCLHYFCTVLMSNSKTCIKTQLRTDISVRAPAMPRRVMLCPCARHFIVTAQFFIQGSMNVGDVTAT